MVPGHGTGWILGFQPIGNYFLGMDAPACFCKAGFGVLDTEACVVRLLFSRVWVSWVYLLLWVKIGLSLSVIFIGNLLFEGVIVLFVYLLF